jgi:hypothetical protein
MDNGELTRAQAPRAIALSPRLLDIHATAIYLGLSDWSVRSLEFSGVLSRVRVPLNDHKEVRKVLFDREDLDRLIESWKAAKNTHG